MQTIETTITDSPAAVAFHVDVDVVTRFGTEAQRSVTVRATRGTERIEIEAAAVSAISPADHVVEVVEVYSPA